MKRIPSFTLYVLSKDFDCFKTTRGFSEIRVNQGVLSYLLGRAKVLHCQLVVSANW